MPPVKLHNNDPISAAKASGITSQTASTQDNESEQTPQPTRTVPASVPATTTTSSYTNDPPPPQPGARPAAPTSTSSSSTSRYLPQNVGTPPAPQPGAAPGVPSSAGTGAGAGGPTATHITTETRLSAPPAHFNLPPPSDAQLAGRSTTTSTTPMKAGPTTLDMGNAAAPAASPFQQEHRGGAVGGRELPVPRSVLEGPPGYVQAQSFGGAPSTGGGVGGGQQQQHQQNGDPDGSIGGAAWNLLAKAGEALKKGEEAAWNAVRKNDW